MYADYKRSLAAQWAQILRPIVDRHPIFVYAKTPQQQ